VDNGSSDNTFNYVKIMYGDRIKVVRLPKNYGYCLGNNLALKYTSNSRYILFQNPDAILTKGYVRKLVEVLEQNPDVATIQELEFHPNKKWLRIGGSLNTAGYYYPVEVGYQQNSRLCSETLFAFGAALLVRRSIFEAVGGFPPEYFLYYDEADLGIRLRALGLRVLGCANTGYMHFIQGTVSKIHGFNPVILYFSNRNRLLTVLKYFYGLHLIKALILNIAIMLTHFIRDPSVKRRIIIYVFTRVITKYIKRVIKVREVYVRTLKKKRVLEEFLKPWP
jgi:GT2 family glycosyltransferase